MKQKTNPCPRADKCIHANECIPGVFRSEYLCFEKRQYNQIDGVKKRYQQARSELRRKRRNG